MVVPGRVFAFSTFLLISAAILISIWQAKKGHPVQLRPIPGYEALQETVGRAVEMGRPVHFTPGFFAISVEMMAGLQALKHIAGTVARYDAAMITTTARGDTYTLADGIVVEAYAQAGKPQVYKPEMVRYLSDNQFAYASAVMGIMTREKVAANIMIGQFAAESLLLAETGSSVGAIQIGGTAQMFQLPFFVATCDYVIIGEELFAADAYFEGNPVSLGCVRGQDIAKACCLILLVIGVVARACNSTAVLDLMKR